MKHEYKITGMTCGNCEAKVKSSLLMLPDIIAADVSNDKGTAVIEMQKHISLDSLQNAMGGEKSKYKISVVGHSEQLEIAKSWFSTYKPVLFIFAYILGITVLVEIVNGGFQWMRWMNHFMAGFFLVFSFFKLLNIKGFAESYAMYDIIAKRWKVWGFLYVFIELGLGLSYLSGFNPLLTYAITFVVMSVSIIGVLQSVWSRKKIKCACLGDVFNLPMSTITIIEDVLMIGMSTIMIIYMIL